MICSSESGQQHESEECVMFGPAPVPYVLPDGMPAKPRNLIFRCETSGHTQTLILRNGGMLWFKDYWWYDKKSEEETAWELLPSPTEADWRRFRAKLEELKIWDSEGASEPQDVIDGGYINFSLFFGFADRRIRFRGRLNEGAWREYEDEEGNETGEFDRMFHKIARAFERLTGREWFYE